VKRPVTLLAAALAAVALAASARAQSPSVFTESDFPTLTVTTLDAPSPGRLYLATIAFAQSVATPPYLMILDDHGVPVFRRRMPNRCLDFKRQSDGTLSYFDEEQKVFVVLDTAYRQIRTINAIGVETDVHELLLLPDGHALVMGLAPHHVDMSAIVAGGNPDAVVLDMVIQELDSAQRVVFEWSSRDHFDVRDAIHEDLTAATIDYVHPNSLEVDSDGNILLSSRHLDEVTKIDRRTGAIIWRLGGRHNEFAFVNDPDGFSHQHDARRLDNGNILLFDNGNFHGVKRSRVAEYRLDETAMTATLVWQYRHTPEIFSYAMGNAQRLPNGNTLIGWGAYPLVTEVRSDGSVAFEMKLPDNVFSYRAFRLPAATALVGAELASPADRSSEIAAPAQLAWNASGGASSYELQVATDSSFASPVYDEAGIASLSARVAALEGLTAYYWRVRPSGEGIVGVWSPAWSFTTAGAPLVLQLVAPPNGEQSLATPPALHWGEFPLAAGYEVQLSLNDLFFTAPIIDTTVRGTYLWLDAIDTRSHYYWRVRAVTAEGPGNWSQIWDFRTAPAVMTGLPETIVPLLPAQGAVVDTHAVRFVWSTQVSAEGIFGYRLVVARKDGETVLDTNTANDDVTLAHDLAPGEYVWRVRGTGTSGEQFTGPPSSFSTGGVLAIDVDRPAVRAALVPNPASTSVTIAITLERSSSVRVRIVDAAGRTVIAPFAGDVAAGTHAMTVALDGLSDGAYLCVVTTPGRAIAQRFVVTR
jgi:hypothetical protein